MTVEEFMKPENAAALETALESCKFTLPGDTRPTNCRAANTAKFALGTRATSRTRRGYAEQAVGSIPPAKANPVQ